MVTVTGTKVVMNGVEVSGKPMVTDLIAVFGRPDRTWDQGGSNRVHTWDRIGLIVYEPFDGRCISATFPFKPMSQGYQPTTMFAGSISVDGKRLTPTTLLDTVKTWPGATIPYSPSSVVFDRLDVHVFTVEDNPASSLDLVEISFWQRAKKPDGERTAGGGDPTINLLESECRAGAARVCTRLALISYTGTIADKDLVRAFEFAKQACARGDAFGCAMLGNMYEAGRGTAASRDDANAAWKRACSLGRDASLDACAHTK